MSESSTVVDVELAIETSPNSITAVTENKIIQSSNKTIGIDIVCQFLVKFLTLMATCNDMKSLAEQSVSLAKETLGEDILRSIMQKS